MNKSSSLAPIPWASSIRGVFCIIIVTYHAILTGYRVEDFTIVTQLSIWGFGVIGRIGVLMFVVMSGYLLGRHWRGGFSTENLNSRTWTYLKRRSWRILPPYWVTVTITLILMFTLGLSEKQGTHWDYGLPVTWEKVLLNYTLLTDVTGVIPVSHQLWSVPLEYHIYLLAPLVIFIRRKIVLAAIGAGIVIFLSLVLPEYHATFFPFAFIISFWLAVKRQSFTVADADRIWKILLPVWFISVGLGIFGLFSNIPDTDIKFYFIDTLTFIPILIWTARRDLLRDKNFFADTLSRPKLVWLGEQSYSLYLVHGFVLELLWRFGFKNLPLSLGLRTILLIIVGVTVSLLVGNLMYRWVEKPAENQARKVGSKVKG